jgi:hypothetical protein
MENCEAGSAADVMKVCKKKKNTNVDLFVCCFFPHYCVVLLTYDLQRRCVISLLVKRILHRLYKERPGVSPIFILA